MLTSIVLKGLPSEYEYFKTVHDFAKDKTSFVDPKKALKNFESSRNLQTDTTSNENVASISIGTAAKRSSRKPEKLTGKCRRCGESGHKQATCRESLPCRVSLLLLDKDRIERCVTFPECLFLPGHSCNLISVNKLRQNKAQVNFGHFGQSLSIFVKGKTIIPFKEHGKVYVRKGKTFDLCSFSIENEEAVLWHYRTCHNHFTHVKLLARHISGRSLKNSVFDRLCYSNVCTISKSRQQPVSRTMEKKTFET